VLNLAGRDIHGEGIVLPYLCRPHAGELMVFLRLPKKAIPACENNQVVLLVLIGPNLLIERTKPHGLADVKEIGKLRDSSPFSNLSLNHPYLLRGVRSGHLVGNYLELIAPLFEAVSFFAHGLCVFDLCCKYNSLYPSGQIKSPTFF